jgi:hypothetical protein
LRLVDAHRCDPSRRGPVVVVTQDGTGIGSKRTQGAAAATRGPAFVSARFGVERMIRETLQLYGLAETAA